MTIHCLHTPKSLVPTCPSPFPFSHSLYFFLLSRSYHIFVAFFMFPVSDLCLLFQSFIFPFSEYFRIFVHSCTCSLQYFQNNKSYFTPRFASCFRLIIDSALHRHFRHRLAHRVHSYPSYYPSSKYSHSQHSP